jgi:hypothetical protein
MKKGQPRPHEWENLPVEGRMSLTVIRSQIAAITRALRDKNLSHKNRLQYLTHAERLDKELKAITKAKLQRQLAELEPAD